MSEDLAEFLQAIQAERAAGRNAARSFAQAVLTGDEDAMHAAGRDVDLCGVWADAMRLVARAPAGGSKDHRYTFTAIWAEHGSHIRTEVGNDLLVIDALRNLLPAYDGPSVTLFRGDSWTNRCRRTYGMSWSSERQVADDFARSRRSDYQKGSCLLEAHVPPAAIVSAVHLVHDGYAEMEFVVDRRLLTSIKVLERHRSDIAVEGKRTA